MNIEDDKSQEVEEIINGIKDIVAKEKSALVEIKRLNSLKEIGDKKIIFSQIKDAKNNLHNMALEINVLMKDLIVPKSFFQHVPSKTSIPNLKRKEQSFKISELEKQNLEELRKSIKIKQEKPKTLEEDSFAKLANTLFPEFPNKLIKKYSFNSLNRNLRRTNLKYTLPGYISIILLATLLAFIGGLVLFGFFLFFSIQAALPIITFTSDISQRFLKLIWIPILFPVAVFIISYTYPSLERKSSEEKIDYELPFATINMAAIAGSMINPINVFKIIVMSKEFPEIEKELTKLINAINVYGYDVVSSLRNLAFNTSSKKFSELLNGLAITINSGGDLAKFLDKRAESLLFEYKLKKDKQTQMAATFMDIYISIVIAAPMIFLLLLMVMKISGLGVAMPVSTITLILVFSVTMINILFLVFLHMKKTEQ